MGHIIGHWPKHRPKAPQVVRDIADVLGVDQVHPYGCAMDNPSASDIGSSGGSRRHKAKGVDVLGPVLP